MTVLLDTRVPGGPKQCPDPELLRSLFDYDPSTGELVWKAKNYRSHIAGTPDRSGYIRVILNKQSWPAHRLIWAIHYGVEPPALIDHVNGDTADNRIENLRAASRTQNNANSAVSSRNASGFKGVSRHKATGKWQAYIKVNGKGKHLGVFSDPVEAHAAYCAAAAETFGDFARPAIRALPPLSDSKPGLADAPSNGSAPAGEER
ncbi:HNH endonuclease [Bosea eneae]|uniref:HNH endonuclease n=1 Tax=Bosea eneae TaxID=151454 RepID=A0ABW0J0T4_9HYPH